MNAKRLKKTTAAQYEELLQFLEANKIIIHGKTKPQEVAMVKNLWQEFADHVNSLGLGPTKSAEQWKKIYWEWKANIKRKTREAKLETTLTGGGKKNVKELTDLEQRLLSLISQIHLGIEQLPDSLGNENLEESVHVREDSDAQICENNILITSETPQLDQLNLFNQDLSASCVGKESSEIFSNVLLISETLNDSFAILNDSIPTTSHGSPIVETLETVYTEGNITNITENITNKRPSTIKKSNNSPKPPKKVGHGSRYTSRFIESAATAYNEAQELRYQASVKNAEAIKCLSESIFYFAQTYQESLEIEKVKAEAAVVKAQAMLMQARTEQLKLQLNYFNTDGDI